jgi:hypothetical protein
MPYTQNDGKLVFIKLEPFKPIHGTWKEDEAKKFIHIRKVDYSSLIAGNWEKFAKNFTENQDWYVPIKVQRNFIWSHSALTIKPREEERPWLSWIYTPIGQCYLVKTRLSASGVMSYGTVAMTALNPAIAFGSGLWLLRKQQLKYNLCKSRGEQAPSILPKVFARKCWFVDLEKHKPYEYANYLLMNKLI